LIEEAMARFAVGTTVPVEKSRAELEKLTVFAGRGPDERVLAQEGVELVELLSGHARPMNMGEAVLDDFAADVKRGFEGIAADMNEIGYPEIGYPEIG
jgi:hypothetical protein